jgi:hypothetical protein
MKSIVVFFTVLFLLINLDLKAQSLDIGPEFGLGKIGMENHYPISTTLNLFNNINSEYYRIGLLSYIIPDSTINFLSLITGILYNKVVSDFEGNINSNLKIIQLPVGFEIRTKKKLFLLTGAGLGFKYLLSPKLMYPNSKFQIGYDISFGMGYALSNKWNINLKYLLGGNITKLYTEEYLTHYGSPVKIDYYSINRLLSLSLRYTITKK